MLYLPREQGPPVFRRARAAPGPGVEPHGPEALAPRRAALVRDKRACNMFCCLFERRNSKTVVYFNVEKEIRNHLRARMPFYDSTRLLVGSTTYSAHPSKRPQLLSSARNAPLPRSCNSGARRETPVAGSISRGAPPFRVHTRQAQKQHVYRSGTSTPIPRSPDFWGIQPQQILSSRGEFSPDKGRLPKSSTQDS